MMDVLILAAAKLLVIGKVDGWVMHRSNDLCSMSHQRRYGSGFAGVSFTFRNDRPDIVRISTASTLWPRIKKQETYPILVNLDGHEQTYAATREEGNFLFSVDRTSLSDAIRQKGSFKISHSGIQLYSTELAGHDALRQVQQCLDLIAA